MAKKTNVICQSNFKSSDPEAVKEAFNKKMALLICRAENLSLKDAEKAGPGNGKSVGKSVKNRAD